MKNDMKRLDWLDIAKGIFISFIVLGHIISNNSNYIQTWIYSFHVCGFFLINGMLKYFTNYTKKTDSLICCLKRERKLIIIYICFGIIFLIRLYFQTKFNMYSSIEFKRFVLHFVFLLGEGVLWFLPAFILGDILFYLAFSNNKINKLKIYTLFLICLLIYRIFIQYKINVAELENPMFMILVFVIRSFIAFSFMTIGYTFAKINIYENKSILCLFSLVSILSFINGNVDLNYLRLNNVLLYYVFAIAGSVLVIQISIFISEKKFYFNRLLALWGKNSLFIMLTHAIFLIYQICMKIISTLMSDEILIISFTFLLTMLLETIFLCCHEKIVTRINKT